MAVGAGDGCAGGLGREFQMAATAAAGTLDKGAIGHFLAQIRKMSYLVQFNETWNLHNPSYELK